MIRFRERSKFKSEVQLYSTNTYDPLPRLQNQEELGPFSKRPIIACFIMAHGVA
jgi:hypothetical protein